MAPNGNTRKLRRGGGWFTRNSRGTNSNIEKMADAAKSKITPTEAKKDVDDAAREAAYKRWDWQRIRKAREKLVVMINNAGNELKEMKKKQERILNEEFVKAAENWAKRTAKKPSWFS